MENLDLYSRQKNTHVCQASEDRLSVILKKTSYCPLTNAILCTQGSEAASREAGWQAGTRHKYWQLAAEEEKAGRACQTGCHKTGRLS
jgi:hypothetical protein